MSVEFRVQALACGFVVEYGPRSLKPQAKACTLNSKL